jgi:hypothetical protein
MPSRPVGLGATLLGAALICTTACGGGSSSAAPPSPSPPPACGSAASATIVIANNIACPQTITVPIGSQVTFVNQDSRPHEMYSDPHPIHTDCPDLNQVGHLDPGQSRQTGNLVVARSCGFHDHINFQIQTLQGTITTR